MSRLVGGAGNRLVVSNVFTKLHTRDKDLLENISVHKLTSFSELIPFLHANCA
jgi:hypothetical protein